MMLWLVGIPVGVLLLYAVWAFNRLIGLRHRVNAAWSDIDVQLKRRWDLVPSLVDTVKGYTTHESDTLQKVVGARQQAMEAAETGSLATRGRDELTLAEAARGVFAVVEAYPDLKANWNFLELQKSLVEIEDNVQYARRYYNAVVRDYNILIASFPAMLLASAFRFGEKEFFQIDADQRAAPKVEL